MISIVISSGDPELLKDVSKNISKTIGVPYEILGINNTNAQMGICEAYNEGIRKAKYDLICFMHEDLIIKTNDWGELIHRYFDTDPKLGLIGIAGSNYKALCPSSWFTWVDKGNMRQLIQRFKYHSEEPRLIYDNPENAKLSDVVAVDGVWFCTRRDIARKIGFDNQMLKGFHGYDVDFSLAVGQEWKVAVSFEVLIEHFSEGGYDSNWLKSTILLHKKWRHILPKRVGVSLDKEEAFLCEKNAFSFLIEVMTECGYTKEEMYRVLWESRLYKVLGINQFFRFYKYIRRR